MLLLLAGLSTVSALQAPAYRAQRRVARAEVYASLMTAPPAPPPVNVFGGGDGGGGEPDEYLRLMEEEEMHSILEEWSGRSRIYRMSVRRAPGPHSTRLPSSSPRSGLSSTAGRRVGAGAACERAGHCRQHNPGQGGGDGGQAALIRCAPGDKTPRTAPAPPELPRSRVAQASSRTSACGRSRWPRYPCATGCRCAASPSTPRSCMSPSRRHTSGCSTACAAARPEKGWARPRPPAPPSHGPRGCGPAWAPRASRTR
jgi:hypothetical protein